MFVQNNARLSGLSLNIHTLVSSLSPVCASTCSTLLFRDNKIVTILGRHELPRSTFSLGPLGNLLMKGQPVHSGAAFNVKGQLIAADTTTVLYTP